MIAVRARLGRVAGNYLPDLVYGANDGIITTFAVVSGVVGASLANKVVVILGLANLFADGLSMGASNYLSRRSTAERELVARREAGRHGLATSAGFVVAGALPLAAYLLPFADGTRFRLAVGIAVGALRGRRRPHARHSARPAPQRRGDARGRFGRRRGRLRDRRARGHGHLSAVVSRSRSRRAPRCSSDAPRGRWTRQRRKELLRCASAM
jgi:hypothetical protein